MNNGTWDQETAATFGRRVRVDAKVVPSWGG